jgi:hypothetical protein
MRVAVLPLLVNLEYVVVCEVLVVLQALLLEAMQGGNVGL